MPSTLLDRILSGIPDFITVEKEQDRVRNTIILVLSFYEGTQEILRALKG